MPAQRRIWAGVVRRRGGTGPYRRHLDNQPPFMTDPRRGCAPGQTVGGLEVDPEWFFQDNKVDLAKQVCGRCPFINQCDAHANTLDERWGVWGGKNRSRRRADWDD